MSQRTEKVASIVQRVVAAELALLPNSGRLTVTSVLITPDLRQATVRIGILAATESGGERLLKEAAGVRRAAQDAVARQLSTKFVPQLTFERDLGAQDADTITRLMRGL